MVTRTLALLLVLAGCSSGGRRTPGPGPSPAPLPIAASALGVGSHSLDAATLDQLGALGVRLVRITLYPTQWSDAGYRARWAAEVRESGTRGFRLLAVVHPLPVGWSAAEFGAWVGERAAEFGEVEAWQIGNEAPFLGQLSAHVEYHRAAYAAVKKRSGAKVVTLAAIHRAWATAMVRAQVPTDAYAVHAYAHEPMLPEAVRERRSWFPAASEVWLTEFGSSRDDTAAPDWERSQAEQIQAAVQAAGGYARAYVYQLQTEEPQETHGILRPDGSWRPAATWLAGYLGR